MTAYIIRRILMLFPVLFGMSVLVFSIIYLIPGNPAQIMLGQRATPEAIAEVEKQLGLDQPFYIQYFDYVGNLLTGDLGTSIKTKGAVAAELFPHLLATVELTIVAMTIAIFIGVNAGIISAWLHNTIADYAVMVFALVGVSMPVFWLGLMEQYIFAVELSWLPSTSRTNALTDVNPITHLYLIDTLIQGEYAQFKDVLRHIILPSVALATIPMAIIARITRSSMLDVMKSDYIRTARAKGVKGFIVVYKHSLRNAVIPVMTVIGLQAGLLLGGAILTETIFGWPGLGRYIYDAIQARDYPVIQSGILVVATIFVFINLIVDLLYAVVDPRIKYN
ncbi:ABC transporter permease [Filobacillus milosensis]|uniref:ABC transporter permease n=1 Tax=Filobacillus milosensis TaxID=94137 RepID=A0A4Y8IVT7_9BACI|nr:ABC transporter permease [Filobacillus milosensis]TFB24428.1 ABC transporter permease [Filobacillus milosensis]